LTTPKQPLPSDLVPQLLQRFWCDEGYTLFDDVLPLLKKIRTLHAANGSHVVIGVVTNSDDRVPDVLTSLGMSVSPLRFGSSQVQPSSSAVKEYDIDFSVMSYHVGHEKPDKRIFEAAEGMLGQVLEYRHDLSIDTSLDAWRKVYIGDEYAKDVVGALGAGWSAVLVDREKGGQGEDVLPLEERTVGNLYDVFEEQKAVGFRSLEKLAEWLPEEH
jgi:FMN phosphatase YigB (HAD superfamily)